MRKLLLLITALLTLGAGGAWADVTVTVHDQGTQGYTTYGSLSQTTISDDTYTTNASSGVEGLKLTNSALAWNRAGSNPYYLLQGVYSSGDETTNVTTITAPEGYLITGYSMEACGWNNNRTFTATAADGTTSITVNSTTTQTLSVTGLKTKSTTISVVGASTSTTTNNWFSIKNFTVTLAKIDFISLTFDKPSSATNNITVNVKDADGVAIPGVTASLESTSCTEFKTGSATALSRTTNSVLAPNEGYGNNQGSTITYTFKVEGLPTTFSYNKAALDVYALTGGGAAQNHDGTCVREWTFNVATGSAANAVTSFVNQTGNDICTVTDQDGNLYHKLWTMTGTDKAATDALYIVVTLTKTDSYGCYAGLGEVQLYKPGATVQYVISDEGGNTVFTSDVLNTTEGDVITELPSAYQRDFCSYSVTSTTMVAGENTVNVTVTYDLPFEVGTDKKYLATLRGHYVYYDETNTDVRTNQSSKEYNDNYYWSFYGNPYSGIKVKNAATGTYLDNTSSTVQLSAEGYSWTIVSLNSTSTFGLYNGSNYINEQNHDNHNLIYYSNFTTDSGSQWTVEAAPNGIVQVTYNLVVNGSTVNTSTIEQPINSDVSIPSSLTSSYSTLGYDFSTSGTIGTEDCTITVTATPKTGIITALSQLSNNKTYNIYCPRGYLSTYDGTTLASTVKETLGVSAGEFAIITYDDALYLYSVTDKKFVQTGGSLSAYPTDAVLTIDPASTNPMFWFKYGTNYMNSSSGQTYGVVINSYSTADEGNQYIIAEVGDFSDDDLDAALAAFADRTPYYEALAAVITTATGITFGTGLGEYANKSADFDTALSAAQTTYANEDATQAELEAAAEALTTAISACTLNIPSAGFYRIKGNTSSTYLAAGLASNSNFNMTSATDATTVFYFDGTKLTNLSSGMCNGMTGSAWAWVVGESASTVVFQDGLTNGGYAIKSATANFYDNGDISASADRGNNVTISSTTDARYRSWYLEEVTTLPVTISAAKYATLYVPVALTIPSESGVKAYVISSLTTTEATLSEITTTIPANTPVILQGEAGTYNFAITTSEGFSGTNKLAGQVAAFAVSADDVTNKVYYTLQQNEAGTAVGLFPKTAAGSIAGFKAYLPASNFPTQSVKGVTFKFEDGTETGINAIQGGQVIMNSDAIFNLAGQRVEKAQRGIYIVNGKKVVIK